MKNSEAVETLDIDAHEVRITHPDKLYFSKVAKVTKLDLVNYFLSIAPGALSGIRDRPIVLKRFVNGAEQEPFYQKRAPADIPAFLRTVELSFPSGVPPRNWLSTIGLAWRGSLTSGASNFIRILCAPPISTIPISCALT